MNRSQLAAAALAAALLTLTVSGCSSRLASTGSDVSTDTGPAQPISIAFVTNNASDYWIIAEAGVNDATTELNQAAKTKGLHYVVQFVMPSDGTVAVQESMVNAMLANGVKAIAISPIDPKNQTLWLNEISSKCRVITQDSDAPLSKRLAYLGTDNHSAGVYAGQMIKRALPDGGKIMLFVGDRDAQNARDREMGIRDELRNSNIQIIDVRTDHTDHAAAKTNAVEAMIAYPDLKMEVGLWSYNGPAILSAIEDAHKVGKVKIVCFDQEKRTLAGVKSGAIYATIVQQPYQFGYQGTKLLASIATGDMSVLPPSGTLYFPAQAVTSENVRPYIAELNKETGKSWGPSQ